MKKRVKKLTLSKETLKNLDVEKLDGILGGYTQTCPGQCQLSANICSNKETCATCVETQ